MDLAKNNAVKNHKSQHNFFSTQSLHSFHQDLLSWYSRHKRDLPFRRTRDPYRIWLSEIMLQQTTISAVIPYYKRFLQRFPTLKSVAQASEQELLSLWQGLGYYSRVRNFQKACLQVLGEFDGRIPQTAAELKCLKGIGDYTAAAIASICFDEAVAVVDGNVKRVVARLTAYNKDIATAKATAYFKTTTSQLLAKKQPGNFNQAMMELGAMVCRPKAPLCLLCPVQKHCASFGKNPELLPVKAKTNFITVDYHALLIARNNKILLKKPAANNLIANMWELPTHHEPNTSPETSWEKIFGKTPSLMRVGTVKHSITNKKITTHVYRIAVPEFISPEHEFVPITKITKIPCSTLSRKIVKKFLLPDGFG